MNTDDKNIIPFPSSEPNKRAPHKSRLRSLKEHPFFILLTVILVPILIAVIGPFFSKHVGSVKISDSYVMHFTDVSSPNLSTYQNDKISSGDSQTEFDQACAVRTTFTSGKSLTVQASDNYLNLISLKENPQASLDARGLLNGTILSFYILNSGDGEAKELQLNMSASYVQESEKALLPAIEWDQLVKMVVHDERITESLPKGDGLQFYSLELSDWAVAELQSGKQIALWTEGTLGNTPQSFSLGWLAYRDGTIELQEGGAGPNTISNVDYVYLDVAHDKPGKIRLKSAVSITDSAVADTVLIPSRSCSLEYSVTYNVDKKPLTTKQFTTSIFVPVYKDFSIYDVMHYMSDHNLTHYAYNSDAELHNRISYEPMSILDSAK